MVIAIIAILASMLLPALSMARERGRQAACLSNEKQIALIVTIYTDEHDEWLPIAWPLGSTFHYNWDWNCGFAYDLRFLLDAPRDPVTDRPLLNRTIFDCPTLGRDAMATPRPHITEYGWNYQYMGDRQPGDRLDNYGNSPRRRLPQVLQPSATLIVGERTDGSGDNDGYWKLVRYDSAMRRHAGGRSSNVLWTDGHATSPAWAELYTPIGTLSSSPYAKRLAWDPDATP